MRLLEGADLAVDAVINAMRSGPPCPACGRSDNQGHILRAAQIVLDRIGLGPTATIAIEGPPTPETDRWMDFMPPERFEQIADWINEAHQEMVSARQHGAYLPIIDIDNEENTNATHD